MKNELGYACDSCSRDNLFFFHVNGTSACKLQIYVVISFKVGNQQLKANETIVMANTDMKVRRTLWCRLQ